MNAIASKDATDTLDLVARHAGFGSTLEKHLTSHVFTPDRISVLKLLPRFIVGFVEDIADRKRAAEERDRLLARERAALSDAEAAQRRFRALFDESALGVALVNPAGVAFESNRALQRVFGYSAEELRSMPFPEITHPDDVEKEWNRFREVIGGKRDQDHVEQRYSRKDGALVWGNSTVSLVRDDRGEPLFAIAMVEDITEQKRAAEALREAQAELAHMSRLVTIGGLAASIAHEVNQPLAAVVANGHACLRWLGRATPDLEKARAAVERMIRDGQRGSDVIGRIRALARKTHPQKVRLDINDLVHEVAVLVHGEACKHVVSLRTELAAALPSVHGDRIQLQQVILNLLMNGIEATAPVKGRPRELVIRSRQEAADAVLVAVQDTGVGLEPDHAARLFEPFFSTKPSGMGIGLSISRSIIEAHGGRLWATPNAGPGATFQFVLPHACTQNGR